MPIEFECTSCSKKVRVPDGSEGRKCRCPSCQTLLIVPEAEVESVDIKLEVPCPRCEHILICAPELEGTRGLCRNCNFIFTIGPPGTIEPIAVTSADTFAFQCPHCLQLFEGKSGMEGRKGKCIHCKEVFEIRRQGEPWVKPTHRAETSPTSSEETCLEAKQKVAPKPLGLENAFPAIPTISTTRSNSRQADLPAIAPTTPQVESNDWLSSIPSPQMSVNPYAEPVNPYAASASTLTPSIYSSETAIGDVVQFRQNHLSHESAIKGFALLYAISSGFSILVALAIVCIGALALTTGASSAVAVIAIVYSIAYFFAGGLAGLVSHGLYRLSDVGKIGGAIFAALSLCALPFGTALGAYLLYLIFSSKGNIVFSERYRSAVKETPQIRATIPIFVWVVLAVMALFFVAGAAFFLFGILTGSRTN